MSYRSCIWSALIWMFVISGGSAGAAESRPFGPTTRASPQTAATVEFTAYARDAKVRPLDPIYVHVEIQNLIEVPLTIPERRDIPAERNFSIAVSDAKGESVPLTRYGQMLLEPRKMETLRVTDNRLSKGEAYQASLLVNRVYDMTVDGEYTITVKRAIYDRETGKLLELTAKPTKVRVTSNTDSREH